MFSQLFVGSLEVRPAEESAELLCAKVQRNSEEKVAKRGEGGKEGRRAGQHRWKEEAELGKWPRAFFR